MQTQRRVWKFFQRYNVASFVANTCVVAVFGLGFIGTIPLKAHVATIVKPTVTACSNANRTPMVIRSDQAENRVAHNTLSTRMLATYRHTVTTSMLDLDLPACIQQWVSDKSGRVSTVDMLPQVMAIPALSDASTLLLKHSAPAILEKSASSMELRATRQQKSALAATQIMPYAMLAAARAASTGNVFPYGQCTWWANQRYYQLHGSFVPWTTNANAGQWIARAAEAGWRISGQPLVGAILVLEGHVQGAYGLGHVAVVEQVLGDGSSVIASSMNWGTHPEAITDTQFYTGPGIAFLSQR